MVTACAPETYARVPGDNSFWHIETDHGVEIDLTMQTPVLPGDTLRLGRKLQTMQVQPGGTITCDGPEITPLTRKLRVYQYGPTYICTSRWYKQIDTKAPLALYRLDVQNIVTRKPDGSTVNAEGYFGITGANSSSFFTANGTSLVSTYGAGNEIGGALGTGLWVPAGSYEVNVRYTDGNGARQTQTIAKKFPAQ